MCNTINILVRLQHGMVPENAYLQMLQTNSINIQSNSRISENDTAPQAPNVWSSKKIIIKFQF